jgi:O-antigen ligase
VLGNFNLEKTYHFLLVALSFLFPLTVFGGNLVIVFICILWIFSGQYKSKFMQIIRNKLMVASIVFFCIHVIGLIWTEDLNWGFHIIHKMWYFIGLLPILYTIIRKENIRTYISGFLLAILVTEICSYLIWFEVIEPFKNASIQNPTPFMSHISYNPILAIAIYIVLHQLFFNKKMTNFVFAMHSFFALSMILNMFITGGRAGQVIFFVMLVILIFQIFDKQKFKSILAILFFIPLIFITAYQSSDLFQKRVDLAINEITNYSNQKHSSVGLRITFAINSWDVIKNNPIIGVGTGDFPNEYKQINEINTPLMINTENPHNMYILVLMQHGLIGLLSMLSIFYYQIKLSLLSSNKFFRDAGVVIPLMFLVLMFSDSYLLGHFTTLTFIFFSSFLYKNFEKS